MAQFDRHVFMFLICSQRQMISTDSTPVSSNNLLLSVVNQTAGGLIVTSQCYYLFLAFFLLISFLFTISQQQTLIPLSFSHKKIHCPFQQIDWDPSVVCEERGIFRGQFVPSSLP